ncbi:hypothetical protein [Marinoscillum furvescens]|uniref:Uncharacterized protein n=1 Tax=Marinoscillum furvescens DSM 4134 TaxID=1122208 RepID=A0A3D9KY98_MARFU|nr:hypothetical protein [Marinoscillum furvescens]RED92452.1 hypothetical protein C7460_13020 [Marinoscillum furvescens DSM 4134]
MKKAWANFLKNFQPSYSVVVTMYHVVPGSPVKKHEHRHSFGKGELVAASTFYQKVIKKHSELGFPNTEVQLIKGKKSVMETKQYGPVSMVKSLNTQSA